MTATYDELVDRYQAIIALRQRAERELRAEAPGTQAGHQAYVALMALEQAEEDARHAVRSHHDAPPQG